LVKVKRRMIAILLGCALVGAGVALVWPRGPKEPEYQGKRLGDWLEIRAFGGRYGDPPNFSAAGQEEADSAIRHIGTNAIPFLLEWLRYRTPEWKKLLRKLPWSKLPGRATGIVYRREHLVTLVPEGFELLGSTASSAILQLERLAADPHGGSWFCPLQSLAYLGPASLPSFGRLLERTNLYTAGYAAECLLHAFDDGVDITKYSPTLLLYKRRCEMAHQRGSAGSVGARYQFPQLYPALVSCITHSNPLVRLEAVRTMGELPGPQTEFCKPVRVALTDVDPEVRSAATNVLHLFEAHIY
jgi:hypothetical protein